MKNLISSFILLVCLSACSKADKTITALVTNPSDFDRADEIVEIQKTTVDSLLHLKSGEEFIILDNTDNQVTYQILSDGNTVIFPVSVKANASSSYLLKKGTPKEFTDLVTGRLIPERADDFIWENTKAGYRFYGPALEARGEISNGMDFFAKRTDKLVIDKWYADALAKKSSFHKDNGEGLDYYMVGRTLGLGAAAPFIEDKLVLGNNFTDYRIVENGPLRFQAELYYAPYSIGESDVTETRIVTFDAYDQLNKIVELLEGSQQEFPLAFGLVVRDEKDKKVFTSNEEGIVAYEEPENPENGIIYGGIVYPKALLESKVAENHLLAITDYQAGGVTYYSGGGWSKYGFTSFDEWIDFLKQKKQKIINPLKIELK